MGEQSEIGVLRGDEGVWDKPDRARNISIFFNTTPVCPFVQFKNFYKCYNIYQIDFSFFGEKGGSFGFSFYPIHKRIFVILEKFPWWTQYYHYVRTFLLPFILTLTVTL